MNFQNLGKSFCVIFDGLRVSYYLLLNLCNSNFSPLLAKKTKTEGYHKSCAYLIKTVRAKCHNCILGVKWFSGCIEEGDHDLFYFLTAIWLPHGQLWAIIERTASLIQCYSLRFLHFLPKSHREPCSEVGSLSPAERLVGFQPGTFRFLPQRLNPLGHSLCYILRKKNTQKISDKMLQKILFSLRSSNTHHNIPFNFQFFYELKAKGSSILGKFAWGFHFLFRLSFTKVYFYFDGVSKHCELLKKAKVFF